MGFNFNKRFIIGGMVFCYFPFVLSFLFIHPIGDDMTYAALGLKPDFWLAYALEYKTWNGRYLSNFFVMINPIRFGFVYGIILYRTILFFLFICNFFSFYLFISIFLKNLFSRRKIIVFSALLYFMYVFQLCSLSEGLYWYTGVVTYQLAFFFFCFFCYLLNLFRLNSFVLNKYVHLFLLHFLLFFIIGSNEIAMLYVLILLFVLFFINKKVSFISSPILLSLCFFALFFSCFVYFSPGNTLRESYFIGKSHRLGHSILMSLLQCVRFVYFWFCNGFFLVISFMYVKLNRYLNVNSSLFRASFYMNRWLTLFLLCLIIFCSIFPLYWNTGILGQYRTVNFGYGFFILFWFINLTCWLNFYTLNSISFFDRIPRNLVYSGLIIIGVFLGNSRIAWLDILSGKSNSFNLSLNKRYSTLSTFDKNKFSVYKLDTLSDRPASIFVYDIRSDPNYFVNTGYEKLLKMKGKIVSTN
jgi:hypothetical protein